MRKFFGFLICTIIILSVLFPSSFGCQSQAEWIKAVAFIAAADYILE